MGSFTPSMLVSENMLKVLAHSRVVQFEVRPKVRVCKLLRILTNLKSAVRSEFVKLYSMRLSKLQGTAAPPSSVPLFPCSKSSMFNNFIYKI